MIIKNERLFLCILFLIVPWLTVSRPAAIASALLCGTSAVAILASVFLSIVVIFLLLSGFLWCPSSVLWRWLPVFPTWRSSLSLLSVSGLALSFAVLFLFLFGFVEAGYVSVGQQVQRFVLFLAFAVVLE